MIRNRRMHARNLVPLLLIIFSCGSSVAQTLSTGSMLGAVSATDLAGQVLSAAVGQAFYGNPGAAAGGSGSVLGSMFATFNAGLLAVGVFWFAYNVVAATVESGESGEFMGRRISTIWMPIRFGVGIVSLVPAFNGFCGAQVIMMYFAKMGIGLANLMTIAALSTMGSFNTASANIQQDAMATVQAMFTSNVCMYAIANDNSESQPVIDVMGNYGGMVAATAAKSVSGDGLSYAYSRPSPNGVGGDSACGAVAMTFTSNPVSSSGFVSGGSGNLDLSGIRSAAKTAHASALAALDADMASLAKQYVDGLNSPQGSSIDFNARFASAAANYSNTVTTALQAQVQPQASAAMQAVTNEIKTKGFMALGSWYQTLAVVGSMVTNTAGAKAEITTPSDPSVFAYRNTYLKALSGLKSVAAVNDSAKTGNSVDSVFAKTFTPGQSIVNSIANWSISGVAGTNPIIELKNVGDGIIWVGTGALATFAVVKSASKAANNAANGVVEQVATVGLAGAATGAVEGALDAAGPFVTMLIMALFFFGVTLAVYIPMLPFVTWFGGIMAWFANIMEGLVASPVGAFVHLEAEGDGMGQRSQHSYLFLLGVLLRPPLMVFGFIIASLAIKVLGGILLILFAPALANAQWNSMTGLVMICGYLFVFIGLALTLVHGSFNLIHIIPDQVITWAGGHISGTLGRDTDERSKHVFAGGVSSARDVTQNSLGKGGRGGGGGGASRATGSRSASTTTGRTPDPKV